MKNKLIAVYALVALLTFGHSASERSGRWNAYCEKDWIYECGTIDLQLSAAVPAFVGGALWPLYWTWTAFDVAQ